MVEKDVGWIVFVVPRREIDVVGVDVGLAVEFCAGLEQGAQETKLSGGMAEVFNDFTTGNVVVFLIENGLVVVKKGVVCTDGVAVVAEELGDDRPGTTTKIESLMSGYVVAKDRFNHGPDELLVSGVIDVVIVGFVAFFLLFGREMVVRMSLDGLAGGTPKKGLMSIVPE